MANREIGGRFDEQPTGGPCVQTATLVGTRNGHGEAGERSHGNRGRCPQAAWNRGPSRGLAQRLLRSLARTSGSAWRVTCTTASRASSFH